MASQKSIMVSAAREPKRERGLLRVAAILDAGATVFAEKGYDGATMTEVAARSNTAIGSLYRFFPTKEALADVLLARYGERVCAALDDIAAGAEGLPAPALADALIKLMTELQSDRAAAIALADARGDADDRRSRVRAAMRQRLGAILALAGGVPPARGEIAATVVWSLLRNVSPLTQEEAKGLPGLVAEVRVMLGLYLEHVLDGRNADGGAAGAKVAPISSGEATQRGR